MFRSRSLLCAFVLCLAASIVPPPARGYSLLTHEQLIDLTWKQSIVPLLLSRYPNLTPAQLEQARAYAYGGCVIQDIGYYPFGDSFFSDLTHYVRSGDFVISLFRNAHDANELAFAVGALSHYIGDTVGHADATNLAVPIEFPKLRAKYGDRVSYAEGEHEHVQTEFAFDINEIAGHHFAPVGYLRHVGLEVPSRQVALAFYETYGLHMHLAGGKKRINSNAYRFAVHSFIPRIAYSVALLHRKQLPVHDLNPRDPALIELEREVSVLATENHWDRFRKKPGIGTYSLAGLLFVLPKIGPMKLVAIKGPTGDTEAKYIHSLMQSAESLNRALARLTPPPATHGMESASAHANSPSASQELTTDTRALRHPLLNRDLDTGVRVRPGGYRLTDDTYARLLHRLVLASEPVSPSIKSDIQRYYADPGAPFFTKRNPKHWATVQADLVLLASTPTSVDPTPYPSYGGEGANGADGSDAEGSE